MKVAFSFWFACLLHCFQTTVTDTTVRVSMLPTQMPAPSGVAIALSPGPH